MINVAIKAARTAGSIINRAALDVEAVRISQKQVNDFVTEVDQAAEAAIIETLLTAYPGHGIWAEESGREHGAKDSEFVWIIDPLDGMTHLCATAMTPRDFGPPTVLPREHFEILSKRELLAHTARGLEGDLARPAMQQGVAFLFGCERFGMSNDDVYRCHACLSIPSDPKFGSLNLAAALQVIAYEWRLALGGFADPVSAHTEPVQELPATTGSARFDVLADASQMAGMLAHWERALISIGFLDPQAPKKLMPRLNQLFNRAGLTQGEIHILRGIAKMMDQSETPLKPLMPATAAAKD